MALIEKALINAGSVQNQDIDDDKEEPKLEFGRFYHQNEGAKDMMSRHTPRYERQIKKGYKIKSSNRNEVLLGKNTEISNVGADGETGNEGPPAEYGGGFDSNTNQTGLSNEGGDYDDDYYKKIN